MLLTDVYARVQTDIGDQGGIFVRQEHIVSWVNSAVREIYRKSEFGRSTESTITLPADTPTYALGNSIFKIHRVVVEGIILKEIDPQQLAEGSPFGGIDLEAKGKPSYYWRVNSYDTPLSVDIRFWPIPDKLYSATISATQFPNALSDTDDTTTVLPIQYEEDIILYCVAKAHQREKDWEGAAVLMAEFDRNQAERYREAHELDDDFQTFTADEYDMIGYPIDG